MTTTETEGATTADERQRIRDEEHVKILGIFYYVSAGLTAFGGLFSLMYVGMGLMFMRLPDIDMPEGEFVMAPMGAMMMAIGLAMLLFSAAVATAKIFCGYWLRNRRNRVACLVIAGITCLGVPIGTVLGVFTFVVLLRDSVRDMFVSAAPTAPGVEGAG